MNKVVFWFRNDLRLSDNIGLTEASKNPSVLPIFILDSKINNLGEASLWWLYHSLKNLNKQLNSTLNLYIGNTQEVFENLIKHHKISHVFCNNSYEPKQIDLDKQLVKFFEKNNILYKSFSANLLWEPTEILKSDGDFYQVFTAFYRYITSKVSEPRYPIQTVKIHAIKDHNNTITIETFYDKIKAPWHNKFLKFSDIGEEAAQKKLLYFIEYHLLGYHINRDFPASGSTSKLSPHLHFGEISPQQIWYSIKTLQLKHNNITKDIESFLRELCWREFSYYLLYHFPKLPIQNFQNKFDKFPWQTNHKLLTAWQNGKTGYPIVDAGMRELWQTGYMHNRVRMVVASFLVKNLLIHWHHGRDCFFNCLFDADLANNSMNWQWITGSGVDASPYFRIFNPILQGEKFDRDGIYTKSFVPELKLLPNKYLHKPWLASKEILQKAGITLGKDYPLPIVDLTTSRQQALMNYQQLRKNK